MKNRHKFFRDIFQHRFRPTHLRKVLDQREKQLSKSRQLTRHLKGRYKGNFFRIDLPPQRRSVPHIPKLPTPQVAAAPHAFKPIEASSATQPKTKKQPLGDIWEWIQQWWRENWTILVLNAGSICTLVGFTRSDVLELRSLSMTGSISAVIYNLHSTPTRWVPVCWSSLFSMVNGWKIFQILTERKAQVHLSEDQEEIYVTFFMPHGITPKQFELIESSADYIRVGKGAAIFKKGDPLRNVYLIVKGSTRASIYGRHLTAASTRPTAAMKEGGDSGAWVGEMAFLESFWEKEQGIENMPVEPTQPPEARDSEQRTKPDEKSKSQSNMPDSKQSTMERKTANTLATTKPKDISRQKKKKTAMYTVVAAEDCVVLRWSHEEMQRLMHRSTDLRAAMTRAMTAAIVGKVINFTVARKTALPTWSTWLDDWKRSDGAQVRVKSLWQQQEEEQADYQP